MATKVFFGVLFVLIFNISFLYAQGLACGGNDVDGMCPLDTWVIVLAAVSVAFAAGHLYKKQKHTAA